MRTAMKKLFLTLICLVFMGCGPLNTAFEIIDIIDGPEIVHSGNVKSITYEKSGNSIVSFEDGISYEVDGTAYVSPGKKAKIIKTEKGFEVK